LVLFCQGKRTMMSLNGKQLFPGLAKTSIRPEFLIKETSSAQDPEK
jgi:hypothetical protein